MELFESMEDGQNHTMEQQHAILDNDQVTSIAQLSSRTTQQYQVVGPFATISHSTRGRSQRRGKNKRPKPKEQPTPSQRKN